MILYRDKGSNKKPGTGAAFLQPCFSALLPLGVCKGLSSFSVPTLRGLAEGIT